MWDLNMMNRMNDRAIEAARQATRLLNAEYMALCGAIERECTEGGFEDFRNNPETLRQRCSDLASQGLCEVPDNSLIKSFLIFVPKST